MSSRSPSVCASRIVALNGSPSKNGAMASGVSMPRPAIAPPTVKRS
jgi:hypothetical protein